MDEYPTPPGHPVTAGQLLVALGHRALLRQTRQATHWAEMALHLALPVTDVVGLHARVVGDQVTWRGTTVTVEAAFLPTVATRIADLVAGAAEPADVFLSLEQDPLCWIKPVRSGNRTLLAGTDILFGAPRMALDLDCPPDSVPALVEALSAHWWPTSGALEVAGTCYLVRGDLVSAVVAPTPAAGAGTSPSRREGDGAAGAIGAPQIDALGHDLAGELGGALRLAVDLADPSDGRASIEYLIDLAPDLEAVVAAQLDGLGAASVGYPGPWVPGSHAIAGWRVLGPAASEPGWVAVHPEAHLRVLLRRPIRAWDGTGSTQTAT